MVRNGWDWLGLILIATICWISENEEIFDSDRKLGLDRNSLDWFGMVRIGLDWLGMVRNGWDCLGLIMIG